MKKNIGAYLLIICLILSFSSIAKAENNAFTKLGRGAANTLTGWLEVPKNVYVTSSEKNPLMGISYGLLKGLGLGIARTAVGLYEVITFPFPLPADYEPIMAPEYVLESESY